MEDRLWTGATRAHGPVWTPRLAIQHLWRTWKKAETRRAGVFAALPPRWSARRGCPVSRQHGAGRRRSVGIRSATSTRLTSRPSPPMRLRSCSRGSISRRMRCTSSATRGSRRTSWKSCSIRSCASYGARGTRSATSLSRTLCTSAGTAASHARTPSSRCVTRDRPLFPLTLRCTRVVFLLLKQFARELETEAEIFLTLLIKIVGDDHSEQSDQPPRPLWMRVLRARNGNPTEIIRGLCSDAELMRNVWARYDAHHSGSNVYTALITALKRLITEKPALLGVSTQIFGAGVQPDASSGAASNSGYGLGVAGMAGIVANAASATVSMVVDMQGSAVKLQCIDHLDEADAPPIPEPYIYLRAVNALPRYARALQLLWDLFSHTRTRTRFILMVRGLRLPCLLFPYKPHARRIPAPLCARVFLVLNARTLLSAHAHTSQICSGSIPAPLTPDSLPVFPAAAVARRPTPALR
ncbi:hypothetical protein B0H11DRAFT_446750 [Mycena galericulata]|nr:hypothetical protein B0H11DRAFT_446750 [Mycena galericulata]